MHGALHAAGQCFPRLVGRYKQPLPMRRTGAMERALLLIRHVVRERVLDAPLLAFCRKTPLESFELFRGNIHQ